MMFHPELIEFVRRVICRNLLNKKENINVD